MKDKFSQQTQCLSCAIVQGFKRPLGGTIIETEFFHAHQAQRDVLGIEHVYYFYNEDTTHHFHMWMMPRYEWMNEFGRSIESVRPILGYAREHMNDEENLVYVKSCVQNLRSALSK